MAGTITYNPNAKKKNTSSLVTSTAQELMNSKNITPATTTQQPLVNRVAANMIATALTQNGESTKPVATTPTVKKNVVTNSGKYTVTNNPIDPSKTYTLDNSFNGILIGDTDNGYAQPTAPAAEDPYKGGGNGGGNGGGYSYYDPSADLMAAYNARQAALQKNYEDALEQQRRAYENSVNDLRNQGDDALRQAYVNMMMNRRGLNQSLEAAGLRGGASESAMAGLYNNYANDRNAIARNVSQRLADLGNSYGTNVSNLGMQYGNNNADAMSDYYSALASARQNLSNILARTSSNYKGITQQDIDQAVADALANQGGDANRSATNLIDAQTGNLLPLANPNGNTTGAPYNDASAQMQQYRVRNLTPARIRGWNVRDAFDYVNALNVSNEIKDAILQEAGFDPMEYANFF